MVAPDRMFFSSGTRQWWRILLLASLVTLPLLAEPAITPGLFIARAPVSTAIDYKGTVDLTVVPPFEDARVMIRIDGNPVARVLRRPYRVAVDLGPTVVEHRIEPNAGKR
jgi:hypothetical protein